MIAEKICAAFKRVGQRSTRPRQLIADHLADIDDLADMMGIVGELPVDCIDREDRLMADRDRF